jgi:hypothetical protein
VSQSQDQTSSLRKLRGEEIVVDTVEDFVDVSIDPDINVEIVVNNVVSIVTLQSPLQAAKMMMISTM